MTVPSRAFPPASPVQLIGQSPAIAALRQEIAAAARTTAKVMLLGETGVGKEVVARLLHEESTRRARPFVAVNCSGLAETLLESELFGHTRGSFTGAYRDRVGLVKQADRGTLFLDELGEMSLRMQSVLLRFTETGEIQQVGATGPTGRADVRLITATNRDLRAQIAAGAFREDLYYRLNVVQIRIPPLRDRGEDILLLAEHFLRQSAAAHQLRVPELARDAVEVMLAYSWPGNVRELRNIAERLVLLDHARPLTARDLPRELHSVDAPPAGAAVGQAPAPAPEEPRHAMPERGQGEAVSSWSPTAERLWARMEAGEDFWTVVHHAFKLREVTRTDLAALVDRGLTETRGSYRAMLRVFNLPESDYKRFHAFLYQQQCNLPVAPYRSANMPRPLRRPSQPVASW